MSDNDILSIPGFTVRMVWQGDRYGLNQCLTHGEDKPMVEFYDARFADDPRFDKGLGQFVSRYYADTLIGTNSYGTRKPGQGLCLQGGVPAWSVDGESMDQVVAWVQERLDNAPSASVGMRR